MSRVELVIRKAGSQQVRCVVNKWKFSDKMMGEQFLSFNISSETPIQWAVGDYCVFRGETFTLNYMPSITQNARIKESREAFVYENVKFESFREELTRCQMLDIVGTSDLYDTTMGTNFTGSSNFRLFCGEVHANGRTSTAVCTLAVKMQVNLDRLYGVGTWKIYVDTTTEVDGVLVTHTDDKMLNYNGVSVAKALEDVHNVFDLDYYIRGRVIRIGYIQNNITSDDSEETYAFGYGKGYPVLGNDGTALFQIKKQSESNQLLVTRLRALGSTRNLPYRYYNKKYGGAGSELTQTMFPTNLQLPDTFLPEGTPVNPEDNTKWKHNNARRANPDTADLRYVKGDTNDSYIDKNDDAASCDEGIREASARWDGSDSNLQEIYPTIEGVVYSELRGSLVPDQDGNTGQSAYPNYDGSERVDELLAIGYKQSGEMIDDANKGDGILPEDGTTDPRTYKRSEIAATETRFPNNFREFSAGVYMGGSQSLFTVKGVTAGDYFMSPTNMAMVLYSFCIERTMLGITAEIGYMIEVSAQNPETGNRTLLARYISDFTTKADTGVYSEVPLPALPDVGASPQQVVSIHVSELSDIYVQFTPMVRNATAPIGDVSFVIDYQVGKSRTPSDIEYTPEYVWCLYSDRNGMTDTFHVFIKDMGFELEAATGETPVMSMKTGMCVGRDFEIGENIQKVEYEGKKGYMLTLNRAKDTGLNIYYPSTQYQIAAGDQFVLLGITMPDAYIKAAELRLLRAATDYIADNSITKASYQISLDEIFLQRNYENMVAVGTPEDSILWRLYAGMKFTFDGIPTSENEELPICDITIDSVTISMGEGLIPKVDIRLNDDVQQGTLQKLTTAIDRIYSGSIFSAGVNGGVQVGGMTEAKAKSQFLSKTSDDKAAGNIEFEQDINVDGSASVGGTLDVGSSIHSGGGATVGGNAEVADDAAVGGDLTVLGDAAVGGKTSTAALEVIGHGINDRAVFHVPLESDNFNTGFTGWKLDRNGNLEVETVHARSAIITDELRINRQQAQEGDTMFTDNDQIELVTPIFAPATTQSGDNPSAKGWYERTEEGGDAVYTLTTDTSVVAGKTYYYIDSYILDLKEKWDGYFTAQQVGNILRGKINTLAAKEAGVSDYTAPEYAPSQQQDAGGNKYYTSFLAVINTHNTAPSLLSTNQIQVSMYGDTMVPMARNYPPCALMTVARWGCYLDPVESGITDDERRSRMRRQSLFMISTSDGHLVKLHGVNKPILEDFNFGTTLGDLPTFIKNNPNIQTIYGQDYLYAQGIIVEDYIKIDVHGVPEKKVVAFKEWVNGAATGTVIIPVWDEQQQEYVDTPFPLPIPQSELSNPASPYIGYGIYLAGEQNMLTRDYEIHDVYYNGMRWRVRQHIPVIDQQGVHFYEPKWNSPYWDIIEGDERLTMKITSSNGFGFRRGYVNSLVTPIVFYGSIDISDDLRSAYWNWYRCEEVNWNGGDPIYTPADDGWNERHRGMRAITITDEDMPPSWGRANKIIFTCVATVNNGRQTLNVPNSIRI